MTATRTTTTRPGSSWPGIRRAPLIYSETSPTPRSLTPARRGPSKPSARCAGVIHAWHDARDTDLPAIPAPTADPLISEFRHATRVGLAEVRPIPGPRSSTAQRPGRTLLEFCRDHESDVLAFCTDTRIWPTNNLSERDLRPAKTQQKISGRLTSEDITQDRLDIRSYIDTIRKHKADVITSIRAALTGDPWQPPIPAPT